MRFKIDIGKLAQLFQDIPACDPIKAVSFRGEVNQYLFEHFLLAFVNNEEPPTVSSIDFSAFSLEDVEELEEYLGAAGDTSSKLMDLYKTFSTARPVAVARRAFC